MFTSRAEYRLLLREDNADLRLREIGYRVGVVGSADFERTEAKRRQGQQTIARLEGTVLSPSPAVNRHLVDLGSTPIKLPCSLAQLLRRPELSLGEVWALGSLEEPSPHPDVMAQVEISVKYEGYVRRQEDLIRRAAKVEQVVIPAALNYAAIPGLSREVREKLSAIRPRSLGQASRIAGMTPAALSLLSIHLRRQGVA